MTLSNHRLIIEENQIDFNVLVILDNCMNNVWMKQIFDTKKEIFYGIFFSKIICEVANYWLEFEWLLIQYNFWEMSAIKIIYQVEYLLVWDTALFLENECCSGHHGLTRAVRFHSGCVESTPGQYVI